MFWAAYFLLLTRKNIKHRAYKLKDFCKRKSRRSPPQIHMHTLRWDSRKSIEARGAASSSMEVSQDRMLALWSRDVTLIPGCTPDSQYTIYYFSVKSWVRREKKKKAKQKHVTAGRRDTQAAISAGSTLSVSHHLHTCMCFFNYENSKGFFFGVNKSVWMVWVLRVMYTHRSNTQWQVKVTVAWSSLKHVYRHAIWFKDPLEMVWKRSKNASRHMWNVSLILSKSRFSSLTTNGERLVFWRAFGTRFLCSQKSFPCVLFNSSCSFRTIWEAAYQQRKWSIWCGVLLRPRSWTCAGGQTSTRVSWLLFLLFAFFFFFLKV